MGHQLTCHVQCGLVLNVLRSALFTLVDGVRMNFHRIRHTTEKLSEAMAVRQAALVEAVSQRLNELLAAAVTVLLGREYHERREQVSLGVEQSGRCHRCKSHQSQRFSRNGYRSRELLTPLGWIHFFLPRVRCE